MEDETIERHVYVIMCKDGHKSEYRKEPNADFPSIIRCPFRMPKGHRCNKECDIIKVKKEIIEKKKKPSGRVNDEEEENKYDLDFFINKTNKDVAELLKTAYDYCVSKGLEPNFRKHYIAFTRDRRSILRLGVGKRFMSMPFNSNNPEVDNDDRVKDTTMTVGDKFMYFWTKISPDDIDTVKQRIDESIDFS